MCVSAIANFRALGDNFEIDQMQIPISATKAFLVNASTAIITLQFQMENNPVRTSTFTISLNSLEEVQKLTQLLLTRTSAIASVPKITNIQGDRFEDTAIITFEFDSNENAQRFQVHFAPVFFPENDFKDYHKEQFCSMICQIDEPIEAQVQRINGIFKSLKNRCKLDFDELTWSIDIKKFRLNYKKYQNQELLFDLNKWQEVLKEFIAENNPKFIFEIDMLQKLITQFHYSRSLEEYTVLASRMAEIAINDPIDDDDILKIYQRVFQL